MRPESPERDWFRCCSAGSMPIFEETNRTELEVGNNADRSDSNVPLHILYTLW